MADRVSVAIVGGGFGGVAAAVELKGRGIDDFVILERGDRLGGVWCANTYPGAACDVPSHLYSLSFAPHAGWSRRFSPGDEIQAYLESVARRFGVFDKARFGSDVERATFDEEAGCWRLELAGGEEAEADVLDHRLRAAHAALHSQRARARHVQRGDVPLRALGPRPRRDGRAGSPCWEPARVLSSSSRRSPPRWSG